MNQQKHLNPSDSEKLKSQIVALEDNLKTVEEAYKSENKVLSQEILRLMEVVSASDNTQCQKCLARE